MFVFYFDKVPTLAMLELMCVCARVTRSLLLFPFTSRINFKHLSSYKASLYKGLLLFVYTHNVNNHLSFLSVNKLSLSQKLTGTQHMYRLRVTMFYPPCLSVY